MVKEYPLKTYDKLIETALNQLKETITGRYLLEKYPERICTATKYAKENEVLERTGSPACTDGKNVFISAKMMKQLLERPFREYNTKELIERIGEEKFYGDPEQRWLANADGDEWVLNDYTMVSEIKDIILHELTHAFNEHSKLRVAARKKSKLYQQKLQVACEIQANDGIMGRTYMFNPTQQLQGVTNKRFHPETLGAHTLEAIMNKLVLNEQDKRGSSASQSGEAMDEMMEATGQAERYERELEQEKQASDQDGANANGMGGEGDGFTDKKLSSEMKKKGLKQVKELILASLTNELKYDATSDCVIYNDVKKRVLKKTYARPSKRIGMYGDQRYSVLRKGAKVERIKEVDKSNVLTVLAVDASGSMVNQQEYVANIVDDLMKQVKEQAEKLNLEVHYENLQATMHRCSATPLVPVESDTWKEQMRNYQAGGGNDFSCVLKRINQQLKDKQYEQIVVLNISDGLDEIHKKDLEGSTLETDYINKGKLKWLDVNISSDIRVLNDAEGAQKYDDYDIRQQVSVVDIRA